VPLGNPARLFKLADREYRQLTEERKEPHPANRKFNTDAADWLQRESAYLRKIARLLDTAGGRLSVVLTRCNESAGAP
jgi:hypothetical protein